MIRVTRTCVLRAARHSFCPRPRPGARSAEAPIILALVTWTAAIERCPRRGNSDVFPGVAHSCWSTRGQLTGQFHELIPRGLPLTTARTHLVEAPLVLALVTRTTVMECCPLRWNSNFPLRVCITVGPPRESDLSDLGFLPPPG